MDICFYWQRDLKQQQKLKVFWKPENTNIHDHCTKHLLAGHHQGIWPIYIHVPTNQDIKGKTEAPHLKSCEGVLSLYLERMWS